MEVIRSVEEFQAHGGGPCVATLGTFDGFHRGHAAIFERLDVTAKTLGLPAVAITFDPHPRVLVTPEDPPLLLTSMEEKIEILSERFSGELVILTFDDHLRQMTADEFVTKMLIAQFGVRALIVGHNHSLGHKRSGTVEHLREIARRERFALEVVSPVMIGDEEISSSRIRRAIKVGDLGQGRKMGWPTANLNWSVRKLLPDQGVYSCEAAINGSSYQGMMFVGVNMLNPLQSVSVEANIFDFDRDIYDDEITLYPRHFVRPNARFASVTELSAQIGRDKEHILKLLKSKE
jgi:riboflavin kinase/FMN adenylyltransferase